MKEKLEIIWKAAYKSKDKQALQIVEILSKQAKVQVLFFSFLLYNVICVI